MIHLGRREGGKFAYTFAVAKPNIHEIDVIDEEIKEIVPGLKILSEDTTLMTHLNQIFPELHLNKLELKVQFNSGRGGCFPIHIDTSPSVSSRQVTCILYVNHFLFLHS